ncbi:MAG: cytidine deaminase [Spirochaetaceae bacterium]|jgi:cytidine deaminase|nr:cytidine deaminase [Spirochaetaceae bacterium]
MDMDALFEAAWKAASNSYSPYSRFRVGAALLAEDGSVITGTNVENRSYGLGICAERGAVMAGVNQGKKRFIALAIATPDAGYPVGPCGACRQVLSEFMDGQAPVRFGGKGADRVNTTIGALLPYDSLYELGQKS